MKKKNLNNSNSNFYTNPLYKSINKGPELIVDNKSDANTFVLGFLIKAGSVNNKQNKGLAHLTEHLLFRNTKFRTGKELVNSFEDLGAYVNAFTTKEYTLYYVKAMNEHFNQCLELLFEMVYKPKFREIDLSKEKMIIKEEILAYEDDPEESIIDNAEEILFRNHPLSYSILGDEKSIDTIKLIDVESFHNNYYTGNNSILSYSGNLSIDAIENVISKYDFNTSDVKIINQDSISNQNLNNTVEISKNYSQSQILKSFNFYPKDIKDHLMMELINISLGEGMSSRLYQNIREKQGLTYNIYSGINTYSSISSFYIYTATDADNIETVLNLINVELLNLIDKGLIKSELNRAKKMFKSNVIFELEDLETRMVNNARNLTMKEKDIDIEMKLKALDDINIDKINQFISDKFKLEEMIDLIYK